MIGEIIDVAAHSRALRERGFTVFDRVFDPAWVAALREDLISLHEALGRPPLYDPKGRAISPGVDLCAAGLAIRSILGERPAWAPTLLHADVIAAIRGVLGEDMVLEIAGAVISDHTRPFFPWHSHIGGVDDGVYWRRGAWPEVAGIERVMTLLYLQDLDDDAGPMLVLPRADGDPSGPPFERERDPWPGQVELRPASGSVIALEQRTWHAIRRMRGPGLRIFVGTTFAARHAEPAGFVDRELGRFAAASPLLGSLLR